MRHIGQFIHLHSRLTQVRNKPLKIDEKLHVRDEEAMNFSHVSNILHKWLWVVRAEQAVC